MVARAQALVGVGRGELFDDLFEGEVVVCHLNARVCGLVLRLVDMYRSDVCGAVAAVRWMVGTAAVCTWW